MRRNATILGMMAGLAFTCAVVAQPVNPVYVDDSPVARETLSRVADFEAAGNEGEAVRELQRLLDDQPDRLVPEPGQNNLFVSVRMQVYRKLLASPKLLERYRAAETARARKELETGSPESVERSRLLTLPGFEAALRVAQSHLESAEFEAARLTLEQLREHPDRRSPDGAKLNRDAAGMMAMVARYTARADVWELADRWSAEAGLAAPPHTPIGAPASLTLPRSDFVSGAQALDAEGVPTRPLWSSPIDPPGVNREGVEETNPEELTRSLYIFPTVVGDCVYVNDGTYISARDRFTLQPRWTHRPLADENDDEAATRRAALGRVGPRLEDSCSVALQGRILVATTGQLTGGSREGTGRTYALDTATGKVLWSFILPELDPILEGAAVRGPAMIDGSTIVLAARKGSQGRRMTALYLAGVSLDTGTVKWVRALGSAGSLPFRGGDSRTDHAPVLNQGIVYCVDRLGIMGAVEAATGRPVWVRRMPVAAANMPYGMVADGSMALQWDTPIIEGNSMITLSPDRTEALLIDRKTGGLTGRRPSVELGSPAYLLRVGDRLGAASQDSVCFVPIADPIHGIVTTTRTFAAPGIRGRVMVSGDRVLVPRTDGLAVIDPATPSVDARVIRLDRIGNVLPMENQLLVVDSSSLHSYVTWSVAQRLLEERMAASPTDPDPAITFAELAYRSQHPDQIAPAVDRAIIAMDRNPASEANRIARQRLFSVLREMVDASEAAWGPHEPAPLPRAVAAPPPGRRRVTPPQVAVKPPPVEMPVLNPSQLAPVMERWGRIAQTPEERAAHLMALGRLHEAQGQPGLAAESYQRVLGDRQLAGATWQRQGMAVRAEIEATRRTRQLVSENGPAVYAAFEVQAAHELEALGPGATADDLERLARQYPAAGAATLMWLRCAEIHEKAGRSHATISMLREGLSAAEAADAAGVRLDAGVMGELGGRLAARLQSLDQVFAAAQLVTRLRSQHADLTLLDHGAVINAESLASGLMAKLTGLHRLARIGPEIQPNPQPLVGWVIMQPWSKEQIGRACEHIMLIAPGESKVALWGITGGAGGGGEAPGSDHADAGQGGAAAPLQQVWSREYKGSPPRLYRIEPESVYLFWDHLPDGAVIERIDTLTGATRWKTEPFRSFFPQEAGFEQRVGAARNVIDTPLDGAVKLTDVAITMDEQVLAMVERSGRVAAFDPATGKLLWKGATAVQQVHDADVGGGVLVLGGQTSVLAGGQDNLIAAVDARTGQLLHKLDQLAGRVRWVRVAGGRFPTDAAHGVMIAGLDAEVMCFDLERGKLNWSIPGNQAFESRDAWIYGDRLFLLDENRTLWLASISTGKLREGQLETFEHLVGTSTVQGMAMGPDFSQTAFSTDRGVCVFDEQGRLVGIDALEGGEADEGGLLPPMAGRDYFVTVETTAGDAPGNRSLYNIHTLDTHSAMLKVTRQLSLELPPRRLALLDGRILVTAGTNTIVYAAPEVDK